ncbi:hypothetical protein GCM10012287_23870 [Streptomyces daqingensis]|uniref:ABC transporter permease n=2 Tax=Streptomyces daqingensis TaxID=1472640 RepID=A0ABQ2M9T5_9ACTN|nr:hypothetical protein GCM10012287_23870 [Streptomyces daqingensis]
MAALARRATMTRMRIQGMHQLAAGVLTIAAPVATWGLVGRQDEPGVPPRQLDRAVQPPDVPAGVETALGLGALLLAALSAALLVRASRSGSFDRRWWQVLAPLVAAGVLAGAGWQVVTAGVIGANIGAGMFLVLGTPVIAGLVLWAVGRGIWLARPRGGGLGGGLTPGSPAGSGA